MTAFHRSPSPYFRHVFPHLEHWASMLQTEVKDERYKFASAIHLFRSDATSVETARMLLTIPLK